MTNPYDLPLSTFAAWGTAFFGFGAIAWKIITFFYNKVFKPKDDAEARFKTIEDQLKKMDKKLSDDLETLKGHETRLSNLEGRMNVSEKDRDDIHEANRVIISALQGILDGSEAARANAKTEVDNFLKSKI